MRYLPAAISLALILHASPSVASSPSEEVHAAIDDMNKAAAKLDADAFMRSYWHSPDLVITFDGETMRGWTAILAEQHKWWSDKGAGITFTEERAPEIVAQSKDVVTSLQWMKVSRSGSKPSQLVITSVWKKLPEGWRVVVAHETLR